MPVQVFAQTQDNYTDALTILPARQLRSIQVNVSAPNAALFQYATLDKAQQPAFAGIELAIQPGQGYFNNLYGIRFRSFATGKPTTVLAQGWYEDEPDLVGFILGTTAFNTSGTVTPIGSVGGVTAVQAGTKSPGQTYTITAPATGTYVVEWGCAGYSESSLGDTGTISCSVSAIVNFHGSTAGSGGDALDTPIALTNGQVITFTVGGTCTNLPGCWAKLTQLS